MSDWQMVNLAAFVAAIFMMVRVPSLASARRVADVLMANWFIGVLIWCKGQAVPLPLWIVNDVAACAFLLALVPGRAALIAAAIFLPIIAVNCWAWLAGVNADIFINVAGWVQLAAVAWGAHGDGLGSGGKRAVPDRAGAGARPAGRLGFGALAQGKEEV